MQKSTTGENILSTKLTGKEIVAIIKACKASDVASIQIGDISIAFGSAEYATQAIAPFISADQRQESAAPKTPGQEIQEQNEEMLILNDALAFEKGVMNGDYKS